MTITTLRFLAWSKQFLFTMIDNSSLFPSNHGKYVESFDIDEDLICVKPYYNESNRSYKQLKKVVDSGNQLYASSKYMSIKVNSSKLQSRKS